MDLYAITSQDALDRISRHCPGALSAYIQCINRANKVGTYEFTRSMVEIDLSLGWTKFKNDIKKLAVENLLEWHLTDEGLSITLAALDEDE